MKGPMPTMATSFFLKKSRSSARLLHELYLLAWNISPFCGDNGDRLAKLEGVLKEFGVTRPQFVSQLPDGNDVAAEFQVKIFDDYAERINALVNSIYKLREDILDATESW